MEQTLISYFAAEKTEALIFIFIGNAALITSALLLEFMPTLRGMIAPLAIIAVIQLVVGGTVAMRTEEQVAALRGQLASAPAEFKVAESARMQRVMDNFGLYKQIEVALLAAGIILFRTRRRGDPWQSAGIGLALQSAVMLVLDLFAEARGSAYLDAVLAL